MCEPQPQAHTNACTHTLWHTHTHKHTHKHTLSLTQLNTLSHALPPPHTYLCVFVCACVFVRVIRVCGCVCVCKHSWWLACSLTGKRWKLRVECAQEGNEERRGGCGYRAGRRKKQGKGEGEKTRNEGDRRDRRRGREEWWPKGSALAPNMRPSHTVATPSPRRERTRDTSLLSPGPWHVCCLRA